MKTLKIMLFVLTAALIAAGCREDSESNKVTGNVRFLSVVKDEIATKSSIEVDDSAIITIGIHLYDNMGRLAGSYNFSGEGEISIDLPAGESYIVYALANVGEFTPPLLEIDMRVVSIEWPGLAGITSGGFPLAHTGTLTVAQGNNSYTMEFVRLVARYDLVIDRSNLEGYFEVTGVRLRNSAADVFPFSARAATATLDGDISTISDLQRLNTGSAVSFYMYENLQGNLLPDNRDPWAKIPDNIPSAKNLCTFIEIEGRYIGGGVSAGLNSDKMTFRFYLGADNTSSFDIVRNTIQTLSFLPSDNSISTESWKVDPGIVVDNRSIGWNPPVLNIVAMGQDTACLVLSPAGLPVTLKSSEFFENGHLSYSREGERVIISSTSNVISPINATLTAGTLDMKKSSILQINVVPSVIVTDIIVRPSDTSLFYGNNMQLSATAVWSDGSTSDITEVCSWSNNNPNAVLLSSSAFVTNVYSGDEDRVDVTITARYYGKSRTARIVCYRNGYTSHSYELNVDPTSVTVTVGSSFQITAILTTKTFVNGEENDSSTSDVTYTAQWITHHPDKATVSAGEVSVLTTGIAIIQASHSRESDFTYVDIIPQTAPTITSISISPTSATITANGSTSFIATATYSDGSMEDITSLCTWSSSDTDAATVSNGTATGCNTTYSIKTTTITATFSGMSATANLTVEGVTKSPTAISISASPSTIEWNGTSLLSATVTWSDGSVTTETDVTYTIVSGEEYVYNYQVEEGALRGNNSESTDRNVIIRGTFSYGGTVLTDDVVVTIKGKEGVSASAIVLFMNRYTIAQGDSPCILSAMVTYSDGNTETFTSSEVTYSLEGENVSYANLIGNTIEAANNSDSYKPVMVKVSYSSGGVTVTDMKVLNVRPKYPVEVQITPSDNNFTSPSGVTLASGQSISFTAVAIYSDGSTAECTSSSVWTITISHSDGGTRVIGGNSVSYSQLYDEQEYTITGVTVTASYTTDDGLKSTTATGTLSGLITLQ
ncbi:MAG TPA: DUF4906 domain-containing protein [Bacteroidales bacterium]|jgi:hypothetical protein|nr:DUF4906 domain-containing protein [Bacteroidales bacterium]HKM12210.1 DUF4906 domain-containing protein [Bacteroidales bacterium]HPY22250.1 DUF4906 domain-containing protein [Bacteroidales bacterium]HQA93595.1 DUF4906 domain-containing protein [Bacteroidales bacterium]HQN23723.1 DUF4906 domain-containing protein [Bacteroidales bacterium]